MNSRFRGLPMILIGLVAMASMAGTAGWCEARDTSACCCCESDANADCGLSSCDVGTTYDAPQAVFPAPLWSAVPAVVATRPAYDPSPQYVTRTLQSFTPPDTPLYLSNCSFLL